MSEQKKPGGVGCILSVVLGLAAIGAGVWAGLGISGTVDEVMNMAEHKIVIPGTAKLAIPEKGTYAVFHENRSRVGGKSYVGPGDLSGFDLKLTHDAGGQEISLDVTGANVNYNTTERQGLLIYTFQAPAAGDYTLEASYRPGSSGPQTVLAWGKSPDPDAVVSGIGGVCFGFVAAGGLGIAALVLGIVSLVRRSGAKKAAAAPAPVTLTQDPAPPTTPGPPQA